MDRLENLNAIIQGLMANEHVSHRIPSSLHEKQRMMRALMNVWEPKDVSTDFLAMQDAELLQGDITRLKVDAIVNAAKHVIHTVGPIIDTGSPTKEQEEQLAQCYRSCLDLAEQAGLESIAFCCISTGVFHFPNERAAEIAVETVKRYPRQSVKTIVFNVFLDKDYDIYQRLLTED